MDKKFKFDLEQLKSEDFKGHVIENQLLSSIKGGYRGWCDCYFVDGFADLVFVDFITNG